MKLGIIDRICVSFFWAYWGGLWLMMLYGVVLMLTSLLLNTSTYLSMPHQCPRYWCHEISIDASGKPYYGKHLCKIHYPEDYGR